MKLVSEVFKQGLILSEIVKRAILSRVTRKADTRSSLKKREDIARLLAKMHSRERPLFFIRKQDVCNWPSIILKNSEYWLRDAEEICSHHFDFLGSGKRNVNIRGEDKYKGYRQINWHRDHKSGVCWDPEVWYTYTSIVKGEGSDIKALWELSRFQHLPTLGMAYWYSNDEKYAQEFVNEIDDWIRNNPPHYGPNWACSMEVAIRAVNWIWGYYFFKDSPSVRDELLLRLLESLCIHAIHIRFNLEHESRILELANAVRKGKLPLETLKPGWRGVTGNHYLTDIVGLLYIGMIFPEFKDSKQWRTFAITELIREMDRQVYPDGVDYEGSISYHRLVTELFLSATLFCIKNGISFPIWYMDRLEKMCEFVMYYSKPDGFAPQINDNDDGRLQILQRYGNWDRRDHRYLLSIGQFFFSGQILRNMPANIPRNASGF